MINQNTRLVDLSVGDLIDIIQKTNNAIQPKKSSEKTLVYGMKGIAKLFGCSIVTAHKIKNSGVIDKSITQIGRKIIVDAEKALDLARNSKVKLP